MGSSLLFNGSDKDVVSNVQLLVSDTSKLKEWLPQRGRSHILVYNLNEDREYVANLSLSQRHLTELMNETWLKFVDVGSRSYVLESGSFCIDLSVNGVSLAHSNYPELSGNGLTISLKEDPFNYFDLNLKGRVLYEDSENNTVFSRHATEMANIVSGAGNTSPSLLGVAWSSYVTHSPLHNFLPDSNLNRKNVTVQNHSYGVGVENYYGIEAYSYDLQAKENEDIIHVFSAGNEGHLIPNDGVYKNIGRYANLTGQFKTAKNVLTVGATDASGVIQSFSSKGPTNDGRIKPEVVALGSNGSSEAAALVSGISALLQDKYLKVTGDNANSALIKAVLVNSTRDMESELSIAYGYGSVNANKAIACIDQGHFVESHLRAYESNEFTVTIPEGVRKFSITLCWVDPPGKLNAAKMLVNDLDLEVSNKSNVWLPWILNTTPVLDSLVQKPFRGRDTINNVEKITLLNPAEGDYRVKVKSNSISDDSQKYYVAYQIDSLSRQWLYPSKKTAFASNESVVLKWETGEEDQEIHTLQFVEKGKVDWTTIAHLEPGQKSYEWVVPEEFLLGKFRILGSDYQLESETFSVSKLNDLSVVLSCENESVITWETGIDIDSYRIYELRDKYFEFLGETSDSIFTVKQEPNEQKYVAVVPVLSGEELRRSEGKLLNTSATCYFEEFYAENQFSSKPNIRLLLSNTYNADSLTLQKRFKNKYYTVEKVKVQDTVGFHFVDKTDENGSLQYQAILKTKDGFLHFSDEIEYFGIKKNEILLAPVPAKRGTILDVYFDSGETILIEVIDLNGKLFWSSFQDGFRKTIPTSNLKSGMYLVKMYTSEKIFKSKFIVTD